MGVLAQNLPLYMFCFVSWSVAVKYKAKHGGIDQIAEKLYSAIHTKASSISWIQKIWKPFLKSQNLKNRSNKLNQEFFFSASTKFNQLADLPCLPLMALKTKCPLCRLCWLENQTLPKSTISLWVILEIYQMILRHTQIKSQLVCSMNRLHFFCKNVWQPHSPAVRYPPPASTQRPMTTPGIQRLWLKEKTSTCRGNKCWSLGSKLGRWEDMGTVLAKFKHKWLEKEHQSVGL